MILSFYQNRNRISKITESETETKTETESEFETSFVKIEKFLITICTIKSKFFQRVDFPNRLKVEGFFKQSNLSLQRQYWILSMFFVKKSRLNQTKVSTQDSVEYWKDSEETESSPNPVDSVETRNRNRIFGRTLAVKNENLHIW